MQKIKCGKCSTWTEPKYHDSVQAVRDCHGGLTTPVQAAASGPIPVQRQPEASAREPWWYGNGGKPLPFPEGRYAILTPGEGVDGKLHFFKIDAPTEGKWSGYVFVKEQAGDDMFSVKGPRGARVIELIAKDPETAMLMYGQELGKCGHCGRTLTDTESRAAGIGPVCRNKISF